MTLMMGLSRLGNGQKGTLEGESERLTFSTEYSPASNHSELDVPCSTSSRHSTTAEQTREQEWCSVHGIDSV
jgi:hypothetical protein